MHRTSETVNARRYGALVGEVSRYAALVFCSRSPDESRVKNKPVLRRIGPSLQGSLQQQIKTAQISRLTNMHKYTVHNGAKRKADLLDCFDRHDFSQT